MDRVLGAGARAGGVVGEIRAAVGLLTRLPAGAADADHPGAAAFALVGAVIGCLAAIPLVLLTLAGQPVLGAIAAVATLAAVSGGLHLDGLADTADALTAPDAASAERARQDPAVGPAGVTTLVLVLGAQVAALASVTASSGPLVAGSIVAVAGTVSRWLPVLAAALFRGRIGLDGLGAWFGARVSARDAVAGGATTALVVVVGALVAGWVIAVAALGGAAIGIVGSALVTRARGRLDGDGLGATVEIATTATLVLLAVIAR
jgi:adenosylcobinamide-GDP ribazoletransferase